MKKGILITGILVSLTAAFGLAINSSNAKPESPGTEKVAKVYATSNGLGPDKWASIWLVQRYLSPDARVQLFPLAATAPSGTIPFDTPDSDYYRNTDHTTFQQLSTALPSTDPELRRLITIIHDIEINLWLPDTDPVSSVVETAYRDLQKRYQRDKVPYGCYLGFFDRVYEALKTPDAISDGDALIPDENCGRSALITLNDTEKRVPEISATTLFDLLRDGADVVFLDVREPEEFAELHIPNAINLQIRNLNQQHAQNLAKADLVISYCVKDFRGFEMANKLKGYGLSNVAILNPYGLKGWIDAQLPLMQQEGDTDAQAALKLQACIKREDSCKAVL